MLRFPVSSVPLSKTADTQLFFAESQVKVEVPAVFQFLTGRLLKQWEAALASAYPGT